EAPLAEVQHRPAILALEDGRVFNGRAAGAITRRGGEVVFNTSLTGYQEVFTDPSYAGQIVCLTYPHIGNVGANAEDQESPRPFIEALVVREFSQVCSSWRSAETAQLYLNRHKIPVIWDIDTRLLVDHHCEVYVVPAQTSAEDVLEMKPDGVFLSNGPGDPEPVTYAVENIQKLFGRVPVFGICLGHQLCGLALGGKTFKLKFGH